MIVGPNILDKSSIDLSVLFGRFQLLISRLIAFAAAGLIAGKKPANILPSLVFALRKRNSNPRNSNFVTG